MAYFALLWKARTVERCRQDYENEKHNSIRISRSPSQKRSFYQRFKQYNIEVKERLSHKFSTMYPDGSTLHNLCVNLRTDQTFPNFVMKSIFGFVGGIVLTYLCFMFFVFQLSISLMHATIMSSIIGVLLTLGLAFSYRIRCLVFLLVPQMFSRVGRYTLTCYALVLILTGPATNTLRNSEVLTESMACALEQIKASIAELDNISVNPVLALSDSIQMLVQRLRAFAQRLQDVVTKISKLVLSVVSVIQSSFFWLTSVLKKCNRNLGKPHDICSKAVQRGIVDCQTYSGAIYAKQCDKERMMSLICAPIRQLKGFSDGTMEYINDVVIGGVKRKLKDFNDRIESILYVDIRMQPYSFAFTSNSTHSQSQMTVGIVTELRNKADVLLTWLSWSSCVTSLFLLLIIFRAKYYQHMYETRSRFDNRYITQELRDLDLQRFRQGRETLLPMNRREKAKYVPTTSFRLIPSERFDISRSIVFMIITTFKLMIHIVADYSLYWVLTTIRFHGSNQTPMGPLSPKLDISISDSGLVARILRSMFSSLDKPLTPQNPSLNFCLPDPHPPDIQRYTQIGILIVLLWFFSLFEPYGLRMRHIIMALYRPERAKARALWLYHHILRTRAVFIKFARRKLHREFKYSSEQKYTLRNWFNSHFPFILQYIFRTIPDEPKCLLCGTLECPNDPNRKLVKCDVAKCPGVYCTSCFSEIGELCTMCLSPIDYGDFSDVSLEKGSSEDENDSDHEGRTNLYGAASTSRAHQTNKDMNYAMPSTSLGPKENIPQKTRRFDEYRDEIATLTGNQNETCNETLRFRASIIRHRKHVRQSDKQLRNPNKVLESNEVICKYRQDSKDQTDSALKYITVKPEYLKEIKEKDNRNKELNNKFLCYHEYNNASRTKRFNVRSNKSVMRIVINIKVIPITFDYKFHKVKSRKKDEIKYRCKRKGNQMNVDFFTNHMQHAVRLKYPNLSKLSLRSCDKSQNAVNAYTGKNGSLYKTHSGTCNQQPINNIADSEHCESNSLKQTTFSEANNSEEAVNNQKTNSSDGISSNNISTYFNNLFKIFTCAVHSKGLPHSPKNSTVGFFNRKKVPLSYETVNHKRRKKESNNAKLRVTAPNCKEINDDISKYRISAYLSEQEWNGCHNAFSENISRHSQDEHILFLRCSMVDQHQNNADIPIAKEESLTKTIDYYKAVGIDFGTDKFNSEIHGCPEENEASINLTEKITETESFELLEDHGINQSLLSNKFEVKSCTPSEGITKVDSYINYIEDNGDVEKLTKSRSFKRLMKAVKCPSWLTCTTALKQEVSDYDMTRKLEQETADKQKDDKSKKSIPRKQKSIEEQLPEWFNLTTNTNEIEKCDSEKEIRSIKLDFFKSNIVMENNKQRLATDGKEYKECIEVRENISVGDGNTRGGANSKEINKCSTENKCHLNAEDQLNRNKVFSCRDRKQSLNNIKNMRNNNKTSPQNYTEIGTLNDKNDHCEKAKCLLDKTHLRSCTKEIRRCDGRKKQKRQIVHNKISECDDIVANNKQEFVTLTEPVNINKQDYITLTETKTHFETSIRDQFIPQIKENSINEDICNEFIIKDKENKTECILEICPTLNDEKNKVDENEALIIKLHPKLVKSTSDKHDEMQIPTDVYTERNDEKHFANCANKCERSLKENSVKIICPCCQGGCRESDDDVISYCDDNCQSYLRLPPSVHNEISPTRRFKKCSNLVSRSLCDAECQIRPRTCSCATQDENRQYLQDQTNTVIKLQINGDINLSTIDKPILREVEETWQPLRYTPHKNKLKVKRSKTDLPDIRISNCDRVILPERLSNTSFKSLNVDKTDVEKEICSRNLENPKYFEVFMPNDKQQLLIHKEDNECHIMNNNGAIADDTHLDGICNQSILETKGNFSNDKTNLLSCDLLMNDNTEKTKECTCKLCGCGRKSKNQINLGKISHDQITNKSKFVTITVPRKCLENAICNQCIPQNNEKCINDQSKMDDKVKKETACTFEICPALNKTKGKQSTAFSNKNEALIIMLHPKVVTNSSDEDDKIQIETEMYTQLDDADALPNYNKKYQASMKMSVNNKLHKGKNDDDDMPTALPILPVNGKQDKDDDNDNFVTLSELPFYKQEPNNKDTPSKNRSYSKNKDSTRSVSRSSLFDAECQVKPLTCSCATQIFSYLGQYWPSSPVKKLLNDGDNCLYPKWEDTREKFPKISRNHRVQAVYDCRCVDGKLDKERSRSNMELPLCTAKYKKSLKKIRLKLATRVDRSTVTEVRTFCDQCTMAIDCWNTNLERKQKNMALKTLKDVCASEEVKQHNMECMRQTGRKVVKFQSNPQIIPQDKIEDDVMSSSRYLFESQKYYDQLYTPHLMMHAQVIARPCKQVRSSLRNTGQPRRDHMLKRLAKGYAHRNTVKSPRNVNYKWARADGSHVSSVCPTPFRKPSKSSMKKIRTCRRQARDDSWRSLQKVTQGLRGYGTDEDVSLVCHCASFSTTISY